MEIPINNEQHLIIVQADGGRSGVIVYTGNDRDKVITRADFIPEHELVMLYDYWVNCKDGTEKSDYIAEA
jgi:hypothetical protein